MAAKVNQDVSGIMSPIVQSWLSRIRASEASEQRRGFMKTADMCHHFFAGAMGVMWTDKFRHDYLGDMPAPRFKLTIAKAFELVAIMGPSIMWDYPGRVSKGFEAIKLPRLAFGPKDDEAAEQRYQLHLEDVELETELRRTRSMLMDTYLNWAQREQPGGLISESHKAITEAIVRGRGCMVTETYKFPGSERLLTRTVRFKVRDLYLDPECRDGGLSDCYWMARKRYTPYWQLERMFKLPRNSLKGKTSRKSITEAAAESRNSDPGSGDIVEWYEIWSKEGVGTHRSDVRSSVAEAFEEVVGDYAYLAIAEGVNYPLNFPPHLLKVATDDEARMAMDWPIPFYKDGRWPVSLLDFHDNPDSAWPLAPMAMGLGELVFLNVVISVLAERCAESCRTNGLVSRAMGDDVIRALKDSSFSGWTEFPQEMAEHVDKLIHYIQTPGVNRDVFAIIDIISEMFDRRTGLTDLMYGANPGGKVDRSATDSANKQQAVSVRPEWMSRSAENWQANIANNERIAAGWNVVGPHLVELLGQDGAKLWDELIANEDPEVYVRQMRTTLEANSIKKPNKFRDNANLQQTIGYVLPILKEHWNATGDSGPINNFLQAMADAMEQDAAAWLLPEMPPPQPSEEEMLAQQTESQRKQLEIEAAQENLKGKQLRNQKLETETTDPAVMQEEMPPEQMAMDIQTGDFPQEPALPVAQQRTPEDMQMLLSELAQSGEM